MVAKQEADPAAERRVVTVAGEGVHRSCRGTLVADLAGRYGDSHVSAIEITALGSHEFRVEVTEGDGVTSHRVRVPPTMVDDLGLGSVDFETLVRESFEFLLEREPARSILSEFALSDIARYFGEYYDEIRARLRGGVS
jgi:hypothetical protein